MSQSMSQPHGPEPRAAKRRWYLRAWFIVAAALAVVAAVAAMLFAVSTPRMTARGTVIDRLTGQPVAAARLHADRTSAVTNARGMFRMDGLVANAALRVDARYYDTAEVKATATPLTVRLTPIPVRIAVTSALTGRPLAAQLAMPDGANASARADGTATVYRIGPGQTVTVAATGYRSAHAVIGPDHTAAVGLAPTLTTMSRQLRAWDRRRHYQAIIDWVLRPATGYTFMGTSRREWAGTNKEITGDLQTAYIGGGYIEEPAVSVTISISWPGHRWDTSELANEAMGARKHRVRLAGQQAWHGPGGHHSLVTIWSYDPVCVTAIGIDQSTAAVDQPTVDATMTGIIKAMTGPGQAS